MPTRPIPFSRADRCSSGKLSSRLVAREKDGYSSEIALVCAWVGDADCAFQWMEAE